MKTHPHPYFVAKAHAAFKRAGGDPNLSGPLAEWAEEAHEIGDTTRGVLVAQDGRIVAHTIHRGTDPGVTYVLRDEASPWPEQMDMELGLATSRFRRALGQGVIHVRFYEVCTGPGDTGGVVLSDTAVRLVELLHAQVTALREAEQATADARRERDDTIRALLADGLTMYRVAKLAGMTERAIKLIRDAV